MVRHQVKTLDACESYGRTPFLAEARYTFSAMAILSNMATFFVSHF
jgi:hypothetical protein